MTPDIRVLISAISGMCCQYLGATPEDDAVFERSWDSADEWDGTREQEIAREALEVLFETGLLNLDHPAVSIDDRNIDKVEAALISLLMRLCQKYLRSHPNDEDLDSLCMSAGEGALEALGMYNLFTHYDSRSAGWNTASIAFLESVETSKHVLTYNGARVVSGF